MFDQHPRYKEDKISKKGHLPLVFPLLTMAMRIVDFVKYPPPMTEMRVLKAVMYWRDLKRLPDTVPTRKRRVKFWRTRRGYSKYSKGG